MSEILLSDNAAIAALGERTVAGAVYRTRYRVPA